MSFALFLKLRLIWFIGCELRGLIFGIVNVGFMICFSSRSSTYYLLSLSTLSILCSTTPVYDSNITTLAAVQIDDHFFIPEKYMLMLKSLMIHTAYPSTRTMLISKIKIERAQ